METAIPEKANEGLSEAALSKAALIKIDFFFQKQKISQ